MITRIEIHECFSIKSQLDRESETFFSKLNATTQFQRQCENTEIKAFHFPSNIFRKFEGIISSV